MGKLLGVIGTDSSWDAAAYKAQIKAQLFGEQVRISFVKNGADGINLYHRRKGGKRMELPGQGYQKPL